MVIIGNLQLINCQNECEVLETHWLLFNNRETNSIISGMLPVTSHHCMKPSFLLLLLTWIFCPFLDLNLLSSRLFYSLFAILLNLQHSPQENRRNSFFSTPLFLLDMNFISSPIISSVFVFFQSSYLKGAIQSHFIYWNLLPRKYLQECSLNPFPILCLLVPQISLLPPYPILIVL